MASGALRARLSKHFTQAQYEPWLRDTSLLEKLTLWFHSLYGRGLNSNPELLRMFKEVRDIRNGVKHEGKDPSLDTCNNKLLERFPTFPGTIAKQAAPLGLCQTLVMPR
jgi:hypothetical protein